MSMKEHKIKIAKREFPLAFSLRTLAKIQEKHPDISVENIEDMFQTVPGLLEMRYLLAEQGARNAGTKLDVDAEWFGSNLPANLKRIVSIRLVRFCCRTIRSRRIIIFILFSAAAAVHG